MRLGLGIFADIYELYGNQSKIDKGIVEKLMINLKGNENENISDLISWSKTIFFD